MELINEWVYMLKKKGKNQKIILKLKNKMKIWLRKWNKKNKKEKYKDDESLKNKRLLKLCIHFGLTIIIRL